VLDEKYGIILEFIHADKDMVEIGTAGKVFQEATIQLSWWHLHEGG
jgi:hypothetical protein